MSKTSKKGRFGIKDADSEAAPNVLGNVRDICAIPAPFPDSPLKLVVFDRCAQVAALSASGARDLSL